MFAALWATGGIAGLHLARWLLPLPAIVSAALIGWSGRRRFPDRAGDAGRVRRLVALWSAAELAAILLAVQALGKGQAHAIVPVVVIIVGLHFLPLARQLPAPAYYLTGGAMVSFGLAGLALPPRAALAISAAGASIALWGTALFLLAAGQAPTGVERREDI